MSARSAVRRSELALAALLATAIAITAIVALDALRFHVPQLAAGGAHPTLHWHTAGLILLLAAEAVIGLRAWRSLRRQAVIARRLGALPVLERRAIAGHDVRVVADRRPLAFCAGLLHPAVYVTDTALRRLDADALAAVVAHEAHHARRRDPLRLVIAQTLADASGVLRDLPARQAAVADLAADAAALAGTGGEPGPLARAMLRLQDPAPERVDHLLGRPLRAGSRLPLATALLGAAGLVVLAVSLVLTHDDPGLAPAALLALAAPPLLACRRRSPA